MVVRLACIDDDVLAVLAHMSQICPGLAVRDCGMKVQATKSRFKIQIDVDVKMKSMHENYLAGFWSEAVPAFGYTIGLGTLDPEDEYTKIKSNRYKMVCSVRCFKTPRLHQYGSRKERDG